MPDPKKEETPAQEAPTAEELQKMQETAAAEFFDNDRLARHRPDAPKDEKREEPKAEDKPVEQPKEDGEQVKEEVKEGADKPQGALKTEKKGKGAGKGKKAVQPQAVDTEELVDSVVQRLRRDADPKPSDKRDESKREEDPKKDDPFKGFAGADRKTLERLQFLQGNDARFKGRDLVQETKDFWKAEEEYKRQWLKDHPGEQYDDSQPDHQDFYNRHEPGITEDDLIEAAVEMRSKEHVQKALEKHQTETNQRFSRIEAERAIREAQPIIRESVDNAIKDLVVSVNPEFEQMLENGNLTEGAVGKMREFDPVAIDLLEAEARALEAKVHALDSTVYLGHIVKPDATRGVDVNGETIYPIVEIGREADRMEKYILSRPREEQVSDGRRFLSRADFDRRIAEVNKQAISVQAKRDEIDRFVSKFWTVGPDEIRAVLVEKSARKVKGIIQLAEKRLAHLESKKAQNGKNGEQQKAAEPPKKAAPKPPATPGSSSDLVDTGNLGKSGDEDQAKLVEKAMFS